jgi:murein tripeptide amidase MpaA
MKWIYLAWDRWMWHVACIGKQCCIEGLVGKPEGKNTLEFLGLYGRIILNWILKKSDGGMDWIDLVQNREGWRAVVNEVMKLRVP